jgi:hypothetical protein
MERDRHKAKDQNPAQGGTTMDKNRPLQTTPDTQRQRWLRYGSNVALMLVLAVAIGVALIYIAQRSRARIDTTGLGLYSLKPQTVKIIQELDQPIELVSLYSTQVSKAVTLSAQTQDRQRQAQLSAEQEAARVRDLLEEYARKGRNITVQVIDPQQEEQKVNALIERVVQKYGAETRGYREYIEKYHALARRVGELAVSQAARMQALPIDQLSQAGNEDREQVAAALAYIRDSLRGELEPATRAIERRLAETPPDYKGAADRVAEALDRLGQYLGAIVPILQNRATTQAVTEPVSAYARELAGQVQALNDAVRQLQDQRQKLGELKLDEFRQSLTQGNMILVLGPQDMRMISYESAWPTDMRDVLQASSAREIKPRFAGEQQVTSAILSLTRKNKPKVAFIRNGGPPLTDPGFPPFQRPGTMSVIAQRLRDYNFEILEKDLTGMWPMQAMQRGMPAPPEPSEEDLRDAIWIVLNTAGGAMPGMPPPASPQVLEHVNNGGSALILFEPQSADMGELLGDWGMQARTDSIVVHPRVEATSAARDQIEQIRGLPFIWIFDQYAQHPLTQPLGSLDTAMVAPVSLRTTGKKAEGVELASLGRLAQPPQGWGETQIEGQALMTPAYDENNDVGGELLIGAAARKGKSRLVVLPSASMVSNMLLQVPDEGLLERGVYAARFPGNAELFMNAVFWLADMETMIAISPSAMDVSRITGLSEGARRAWGIGVLWGGLPLLVIAAGLVVYFVRRD